MIAVYDSIFVLFRLFLAEHGHRAIVIFSLAAR